MLFASVAPVAWLLHFIYVRDKYEREPIGQVAKVYFLSFFAVIPALIFESVVLIPKELGLIGIAVSTFCVIAFSEEIAKYWALRWIAIPHPSFNEVYDGIIYGVAAALGFATVENIAYVLMAGDKGLMVAVLRAFLAVPGHALWGVMMGYYIGLAKFEPDMEKKRHLVWKGVLIAIFWHGLYDFFAFGTDQVSDEVAVWFGLAVLAVIAINWFIAIRMIRAAQEASVFKRPNPLVNPVQAYKHNVKFCHQCGAENQVQSPGCGKCGYRFPGG